MKKINFSVDLSSQRLWRLQVLFHSAGTRSDRTDVPATCVVCAAGSGSLSQ